MLPGAVEVVALGLVFGDSGRLPDPRVHPPLAGTGAFATDVVDDSGDDALSAETPIKEDKDSGGNDSGDDIESSEIDMLLSQLDEED